MFESQWQAKQFFVEKIQDFLAVDPAGYEREVVGFLIKYLFSDSRGHST